LKIQINVDLNISLGWNLISRKDYKNYKFCDGTYAGISTVFLDFNIIHEKFGAEAMIEDFDKLMTEKGIELYIVLSHYKEEGEVRRQMLMHWKNSEGRKHLEETLEKFDALSLKEIKFDHWTE
jgi:hypothetical protein